MTPETEQRRKEFQQFIEQVLAPETAVKGVVAIGSMATGHMTPVSDVDAVIFLDPFDLYIVPAEARWRASDDTFHSIFDESVDGLPVDFLRLNWKQWSDPEFTWPEGKVLFDEIEDIFINHGYQSPLMYMHRSPGLLMVKAKAKRNRDGK